MVACCPLLDETVDSYITSTRGLMQKGERSEDSRQAIEKMTMTMQDAVNETVRRICGRTNPGSHKQNVQRANVWYKVLVAVRQVKSAVELCEHGDISTVRANVLRARDKVLREKYAIACAVQRQEQDDWKAVDIPWFPCSVEHWPSWMEEYVTAVLRGKNSVYGQAQQVRSTAVKVAVDNSRTIEGNSYGMARYTNFYVGWNPSGVVVRDTNRPCWKPAEDVGNHAQYKNGFVQQTKIMKKCWRLRSNGRCLDI